MWPFKKKAPDRDIAQLLNEVLARLDMLQKTVDQLRKGEEWQSKELH